MYHSVVYVLNTRITLDEEHRALWALGSSTFSVAQVVVIKRLHVPLMLSILFQLSFVHARMLSTSDARREENATFTLRHVPDGCGLRSCVLS